MQPLALPIARACYALAELTRRAEGTEEHDLLCIVVLVGFDDVSLPAAGVANGVMPALTANELAGGHDAMIAPAVWPA